MAAGLMMAGCTVFPEKKASVKTTTSAEQLDRLSWQMARNQDWGQLQPLLAANVVWTLPGKTLNRDDVVPYLKTLSVRDYTIRDLSVKPNGPDMTIAYTLQLAPQAGPAQDYSVVSVWQQVKGGQVLILRSEFPVNVTTSVTNSNR
jgi:hypothetical protein